MCYKSVESVHNVNKNAQIWMSFKGPKSRGGPTLKGAVGTQPQIDSLNSNL